MAMRMDETVSGVKADLAIKIFGDDFRTLDALGEQVAAIGLSGPRRGGRSRWRSRRASRNCRSGRPRGAGTLRAERLGCRGSGRSRGQWDVISEVIDGQKRYTVALRLPDRYRTDPRAMGNHSSAAPAGEQVPLGEVAEITVTRGAEMINREEGQRRIVVMSNVRGRDLGSFVAEVRAED